MNRAKLDACMRIAGYHDDKATWARLCVENRVTPARARKCWADGRKLRAGGVKCTCPACGYRAAP